MVAGRTKACGSTFDWETCITVLVSFIPFFPYLIRCLGLIVVVSSCEYLDDCEWRIGIRNSLELIHQLNKSDSDVSVSDQDPKMEVPNPDGSSENLSST